MSSNPYKPFYDKIKREQAIKLYSSGLSVRETAERKVYRWIKSAGVKTRPRSRPSTLSNHSLDELRAMVENQGLRKVAENLGVSHVTLWEYLKRRE